MIQTGTISSQDGTSIFFREALVPNCTQAVVLVHGFAEHSGRYEHVMAALNDASISVMAIDLRGHGRSGGVQGHMESVDQYVEDIHTAVTVLKEKSQRSKIILMAHSMGGMVASHYAVTHPKELAGLVMSSPLMGIKVHIPTWKWVVGEVMANIKPFFQLKSTIDANDLTHDKAIVALYQKDDLNFHFVKAKWFSQIQTAIAEAQGFASRIQTPLLLQLSDPDRIVDAEKSREWFQKCQMPDRKQLVYSGFFHEIYNELEREKPIRDAIQWITTRK